MNIFYFIFYKFKLNKNLFKIAKYKLSKYDIIFIIHYLFYLIENVLKSGDLK